MISPPVKSVKLTEIAGIFGRLGLLGFGGPIAAIAMMEEELSRRRGWVSIERFTEMVTVCKMLPGPVSTQMAIYLGHSRAGVRGGLIAGSFFILPSFGLMLALSAWYVRLPVTHSAASVLGGMQVAALIVIFFSVYQLSKPYRSKPEAWVIAAVSAAVTCAWPGWEPLMILGWGMLGILRSRRPVEVARITLLLPLLFWVCFKAGAFVFGTGLAIVPLLEADVVQKYGWLNHNQFMDGLAMGQVTPGPVVITATFIGYLTAGMTGAMLATAGIFLPAFVNVLFVVPRVWNRFSGTPAAAGFTAWAIPAVVGGIAGSTVRLTWMTLTDIDRVSLFILCGLAAWRFRPPSWLLIPAAGLAGGLLALLKLSP